jgi:hypothetical protein
MAGNNTQTSSFFSVSPRGTRGTTISRLAYSLPRLGCRRSALASSVGSVTQQYYFSEQRGTMTPRPVSSQFIVRFRSACMAAVVIVATTMMMSSSSSGTAVVAADASSAAVRRPVAAFLKRKKSYTPLLLFKVPRGTMDECECLTTLSYDTNRYELFPPVLFFFTWLDATPYISNIPTPPTHRR